MNMKALMIGTAGAMLLCAGCADKEELARAQEMDDQYLYVTSGIMSRSPKGNKADWLYFEYTVNHSCDYLYNRANPESEVEKLYNAGAKPEDVAAIYRSGGFVQHGDPEDLSYARCGFYCADYQDSAFNKRNAALLWSRCEFSYDFGNYYNLDGVSGLIYNVSYIFSVPCKLLRYLKCADGILGYFWGVCQLLLGTLFAIIGVVVAPIFNTLCHPIETLANLTIGFAYFDSPYSRHWFKCVLNTNIIASLWDLIWGGMIYPLWQALIFWL